LSRVLTDLGPGRLQCVDLGLGRAARAGDDGARVPHLLARRGRDAGDVGDDRLVHLGLDVVGRLLLLRAPDLAYHDHGLGVGVGLEAAETVDEARARPGIAADADARGPPEPRPG